ncbi:hypothetical protein TWF173_008751 [Orbilia oligospora]|nr:hypothetical protein TWF173_008751 [Orbilia oligospora]
MANWTFTAALAVTTIFSFTAEANPHRYRHHHLRRATTPSYTLVYSGVKRVPDFDDCIGFTSLESSGTYSTVAKECASTADVPTTGAKFFAVYQTDDQKGINFWWCGWWETPISDMADVIESYQEDGDAIYKAYGYNFTPPASSLTSSSSVKGSTSSSASTKGSTFTPASVKGTASTSAKAASSTSSSVKSATSTRVSSTTPVVNTSKSDSTSAVKKSSTSGNDAKPSPTLKTASTSSTVNASISSAGSASSSANTSPSSASFLTGGNTSSSTHTGKTKLKTSSSSGMVSATSTVGSDLSATPTTLAKKASSTGSTSSTTPSAAAINKASTSSSSSEAPGKLSTQTTPTGVTTVAYVATATGIAGFSFVTGAINAVPSQNIINYWISDTDLNAKFHKYLARTTVPRIAPASPSQSGLNKPGLTV